MDKPIVNMTYWKLFISDDSYGLSGICEYYPNGGKNIPLYGTSGLISFSYENEVLIYESKNTLYRCPLKRMSDSTFKYASPDNLIVMSRLSDGSDCILDKIISAAAKLAVEDAINSGTYDEDTIKWLTNEMPGLDEGFKTDAFLNRLRELQNARQAEIEEYNRNNVKRLTDIARRYEDCIYIEVSNVHEGNTLAYHLEDYIGVVPPEVHTGTFQDSVIYTKYRGEKDTCSLDFRYFPDGCGNGMNTYSWSDNIKHAVIKNDMGHVLRFNDTYIEEGDTAMIYSTGHAQGLVSPDCYNGKSMFSISDVE